MAVRVERPSVSISTSPSLREQVGELAMHEANALLELRFLVLLGRLECAAQVVEHRQDS